MLRLNRDTGQLQHLQPLSLSQTSVSERPQLKPAFLHNPAKLCQEIREDLFILGTSISVGFDFDRPVDLLAVDRDGHLVVIMVQQDSEEVPLASAIILAAEISHWRLQDLKKQVSDSELDNLRSHLNLPLDDINRLQRIILVSDQYSPEFLQAAQWLNRRGTEISYVRFSALQDSRTKTDYLFSSSQPSLSGTGEMVILRDLENETEVLIQVAKHDFEQLNDRIESEIGRRIRAEKALRASERRYQLLTKLSPVGVFHTDRAGNYLYVNERWCEISGQSRQGALRQGWVKTIHPEDRAKVLENWAQSIETGSPFRAEYRFSLPGGQISWIVAQAEVCNESAGTPKGFVGTVTELHRTEN